MDNVSDASAACQRRAWKRSRTRGAITRPDTEEQEAQEVLLRLRWGVSLAASLMEEKIIETGETVPRNHVTLVGDTVSEHVVDSIPTTQNSMSIMCTSCGGNLRMLTNDVNDGAQYSASAHTPMFWTRELVPSGYSEAAGNRVRTAGMWRQITGLVRVKRWRQGFRLDREVLVIATLDLDASYRCRSASLGTECASVGNVNNAQTRMLTVSCHFGSKFVLVCFCVCVVPSRFRRLSGFGVVVTSSLALNWCSRMVGDGFQAQKGGSWISGKERAERVLASAISIDGRREWTCKFCSESNVWTRWRCRRCYSDIPAGLHGKHRQAVAARSGGVVYGLHNVERRGRQKDQESGSRKQRTPSKG